MAFVPDDLRDVSTPDTDKNYFKIVITDLELLTTYPLQFRWQYEDKTYSDWSAVKNVTTIGESVDIPSAPSVDAAFGYLIITWDGNNSAGSPMLNIDRINVYIDNVYYGAIFTKGFTGKLSVALSSGTYSVTFKAVTKLGKLSAASAATTGTITFGVQDAYNDLQNKLEASSSVIANAQNQITEINGSGVVVYSSSSTATSGNRIVLNAEGLSGFKSDGKASFAILTQTKYFDPTSQIMYSTNDTGREEIAAGTGFFNGAIYAQSGRFVGNLTVSGSMKLGIDAGGSGNHGIYISSNNYWYAGGAFKVGSSNYYMSWDTSVLTIKGDVTGSTFSSTNGTTNGITIGAGSFSDEINFYRSSGLKSRLLGNDGGFIIFGPADQYFNMVNGGSTLISNPNATAQILISSAAVVQINTDTNASSKGIRNIQSSTVEPNLSSGGAAAESYLVGDIYLVRES